MKKKLAFAEGYIQGLKDTIEYILKNNYPSSRDICKALVNAIEYIKSLL